MTSLRVSGSLSDQETIAVVKDWHMILDELSGSFSSTSYTTLEDILTANDRIAHLLRDCMQWLLDTLPRGELAQWRYVDSIISAGCAYPSRNQNVPCDPSYNNWLDILDALEHGPSMRLFCHLLQVVARRSVVEWNALEVTNDEKKADIMSTIHSHGYLARQMAARILPEPKSNIHGLDLVVWLKKAFLRHWDGEVNITEGSIAFVSLILLEYTFEDLLSSNLDLNIEDKLFEIPVVAARVDAVELARTWMDGSRLGHLFCFKAIFSLQQEATYFRTLNHLKMRKANSDAEKVSKMRRRCARMSLEITPTEQLKYLEEHYLLLNVSRNNVLRDAFDQLWQRRSSELLRPLRVRLGEMDGFEVGHDLGGVQIEFFNLVCKELFDESTRKPLQSGDEGV